MNIAQHLAQLLALTDADYTRLILDTLPGEAHKEKFDYLTKLMYDRDTYKSEIEAAENIARRMIEENKGLKSENEDLKAENEHLYTVLRLCKDAFCQHKFEHNHQDTAIIERAESELSDLLNGGYTDKELNCKGCFGPCGRCEETED
jgi:regulator of replication initiation timing